MNEDKSVFLDNRFFIYEIGFLLVLIIASLSVLAYILITFSSHSSKSTNSKDCLSEFRNSNLSISCIDFFSKPENIVFCYDVKDTDFCKSVFSVNFGSLVPYDAQITPHFGGDVE